MHTLDAAPFWPRLAAGALAALLTWGGATWLGSKLVAPALGNRHRLDRIACGAAVGYALLGMLVAVLALTRARQEMAAGAPLLLIAAALALSRLGRSSPPQPPRAAQRLSGIDLVAIAIFALAFLTSLVAAALPAVWWDPIAYHLPIVERAVRTHALAFEATLTQSGWPLLGESAALPAYVIAGSAGASLVTLGSGVALALVCGSIAAAYDPRARWLATALVAASGIWLWLAPSFYVDVPYALFAVSAIGLAMLPRSKGGNGTACAVICGMLAGAAAAVKLPGIAFVLLPALIAVARPSRSVMREAAIFLAAVFLIAAPWYLRSYVLTGDPAYPFLSASIAHADAVRAFAERYVTMTRNWCGGGYGLVDAFAAPYRLLADPKQFCGDPGYALRLGAVFFVAAFALVKNMRIPAIVTLVLGLLWFAEDHQGRFLVPALSIYAVVVAAGAIKADERFRGAGAGLLLALAAFGVLENWLPGTISDAPNSVVPAYEYMAGSESGDAYLGRRLESYAAAVWLRQHAAGANVFALDDVRDYYFGPQTIWGNPYYQPVWHLDWTAPARRRYVPLETSGVSYMVVNANPAYVQRTPTGVDWAVLASDERAGVIRRVFASNDVIVYRLVSP